MQDFKNSVTTRGSQTRADVCVQLIPSLVSIIQGVDRSLESRVLYSQVNQSRTVAGYIYICSVYYT